MTTIESFHCTCQTLGNAEILPHFAPLLCLATLSHAWLLAGKRPDALPFPFSVTAANSTTNQHIESYRYPVWCALTVVHQNGGKRHMCHRVTSSEWGHIQLLWSHIPRSSARVISRTNFDPRGLGTRLAVVRRQFRSCRLITLNNVTLIIHIPLSCTCTHVSSVNGIMLYENSCE